MHTPAQLERARRVGWMDAAIEATESLKEAVALGHSLRDALEAEAVSDSQATAARGGYRHLIVRDTTPKQ